MRTRNQPVSLSVRAKALGAFNAHKRNWKTCERCPLAETRSNVCLVRGRLPADLLFIGEAPGESEDALGEPFIGPAGTMLNEIINAAILDCSQGIKPVFYPGRAFTETFNLTWACTNVVGCYPQKESPLSSGETREPTKKEAEACRPRLVELIEIAKPRAIVTLGAVAKRFLPKKLVEGTPRLELIHPSAIIRNEGPKGNLQFKRSVLALSRLIKDLCP